MRKSEAVLLFRPKTDADRRFYDGYDPSFLLNKASLIYTACEHPEKLEAFIVATGGDPGGLDAAVFHGFVAELHFCVLHQFEALFALLLARLQPLAHWVYLSEYRTEDIKKKAQQYLNHDYAAASGGTCQTEAEFIITSVYCGATPPADLESKWAESIADVGWLIEEGAKRYLSSPEYNAYKHGLRVLPGSMTLMIGLGLERNDFKPVLKMESSVTYLERESVEGGLRFTEVTKEIRADDAYQWIQAMASIAEAVKTTRLAALRGVPVGISIFTVDRIGLTRLRPTSNFRVSF